MDIKITMPLTEDKISELKMGDRVLLSGILYTARDAAHKRLIELIDENNKLPFKVENAVIYYVGPSPAKPGEVIGSAGPTTSYRMDSYAPRLMDLGLKGMIGKGNRDDNVINSIKKNKAVYFAAIGGAAALISNSIVSSEVIAYEDLGSEAIRQLEVKDMPVIVAIDSNGNNLYEEGPKQYKKIRTSK